MNPSTRREGSLWLALVFITGAAIGGVFGYTLGRRSYAAAKMTGSPLTEPGQRAKRLADLTKELELTPEQASSVDIILSGAHDRIKMIHDKETADLDAIRQRACGQMRQMLTPEQRPKYEAMLQRIAEEG